MTNDYIKPSLRLMNEALKKVEAKYMAMEKRAGVYQAAFFHLLTTEV